MPGLTSNRPDIVNAIEKMQHYADPANIWLPQFMDLNNKNKHKQLTPQTRSETKTMEMKVGSTTLNFEPGASLNIGQALNINGKVIPGPISISPENPPDLQGAGTVKVTTWISFKFSSNNEPVIPFLEKTTLGISFIGAANSSEENGQ